MRLRSLFFAELKRIIYRPGLYVTSLVSVALIAVGAGSVVHNSHVFNVWSVVGVFSALQYPVLVWATSYGALGYESGDSVKGNYLAGGVWNFVAVRLAAISVATLSAMVVAVSVSLGIIVLYALMSGFQISTDFDAKNTTLLVTTPLLVFWFMILGFAIGVAARGRALSQTLVSALVFAPYLVFPLINPELLKFTLLAASSRLILPDGSVTEGLSLPSIEVAAIILVVATVLSLGAAWARLSVKSTVTAS